MSKILRDIYYNIKTGFKSEKKLYATAKKEDQSITHKQVKEFLKNEETNELFEKNRTSKKGELMIVSPQNSYQGDLVYFKDKDPKYIGILCMVNINTKKGFVEPIEKKNIQSNVNAFNKILKRMKKENLQIDNLTTDNESSFLSGTFQDILTKNDIKHFTNEVGDHNTLGIIDAFSRTLKYYQRKISNLRKKRIENGTMSPNALNWSKYIKQIEHNYNTTIPDTIKQEPNDVKPAEEEQLIVNKLIYNTAVIQKTNHLDKDIVVRVKRKKKQFDKSNKTVWTEDIFKVQAIIGNKYELIGESGDIIRVPFDKVKETQKKFKLKTTDEKGTKYIEKLIGERVKNRKKEYLVKWDGLPKSKSSWINIRALRGRTPNQKIDIEKEWDRVKKNTA